jgi:hypothetical protein
MKKVVKANYQGKEFCATQPKTWGYKQTIQAIIYVGKQAVNQGM